MSLYRGIVVDTDDPEGLLRVRASVPQLYGQGRSDWMWPSIPIAMGVQVPDVGDPVWVMLEGDDPARPVWVGTWRTRPQGGLDPDLIFGGVVGETTFGLSPDNGSAYTVSRSDHTHGSPTDPIPAHVALSNPHDQYATDADLALHAASLNPHPNYSTDVDLAALQAALDAEIAGRLAAAEDDTVLHWMTRVG